MRRFTVITVALASTVAFLVGLILAGQFTPTSVVTTAPRFEPSPGSGIRPGRRAGSGALAAGLHRRRGQKDSDACRWPPLPRVPIM